MNATAFYELVFSLFSWLADVPVNQMLSAAIGRTLLSAHAQAVVGECSVSTFEPLTAGETK